MQTLALLQSSSGSGGGKEDLGLRDINPSENRKEALMRRERRESKQISTALKGAIANKETEEMSAWKLI